MEDLCFVVTHNILSHASLTSHLESRALQRAREISHAACLPGAVSFPVSLSLLFVPLHITWPSPLYCLLFDFLYKPSLIWG